MTSHMWHLSWHHIRRRNKRSTFSHQWWRQHSFVTAAILLSVHTKVPKHVHLRFAKNAICAAALPSNIYHEQQNLSETSALIMWKIFTVDKKVCLYESWVALGAALENIWFPAKLVMQQRSLILCLCLDNNIFEMTAISDLQVNSKMIIQTVFSNVESFWNQSETLVVTVALTKVFQ